MIETSIKTTTGTAQFLADILAGLKAAPKSMDSKYFYDLKGDAIFRQIMNLDEYYLTGAEMDILSGQSGKIAEIIGGIEGSFDLIELGAGDATKSVHLLKELISREMDFTYFPVDISTGVIRDLENRLPLRFPSLDIKGLNGEYMDMLVKSNSFSDRRKVVLFMGANIGNMNVEQALSFCRELRQALSKNDMLVIGFDLKKDPRQILAAYNDRSGITSKFNLNLLERINRELNGDFNTEDFYHYACYDPASGACKSFLVSKKDQTVHIGDAESINFSANEYIFMEISQKYSLDEIEQLALKSGFQSKRHFFDRNSFFVDSVWMVD